MKPGRNDPCSCGSGKKFKYCCMAKIELMPPSPLAPPPAEIDQLGILFNTGRYADLQSRSHQLLGQYPNSGMIWKLFGLSLQLQGKDALHALKRAAELLPKDAEAHGNLAAALRALGQLEGSIESGRRALKINPNFAEAYNNLGVSLQDLGQLNEAVENYRRAIKIKPGFAEAHNNLGSALKDIGQLENGLASYSRALEINPDFTDARSNLLQVLSYSSSHAASDVLEQARQYGRQVAKKVNVQFSVWQCEVPAERLRVGLVSGDLNNHPVGYFLESLLAQLDHSRIELIAYPTNPLTDELTTRIKPFFAAWKPLYSLSDATAATLIHADGVHVLLDLSGHTEYNRLPVFAWKPAPVQASWLGYWSTTGVAEMDYLLADKVSIPEARRGDFSESVWYLPDTRLCFTPPEIDLPVASLPAIKSGHLTFGCFQRPTKVSDEVLMVWGRILSKLPDATLRWQSKQFGDAAMTKQLLLRLQKNGIDPARVSLHGAVPREAYLAAYAEVDMVLDTFPHPGGTTTCEALWMGVPTLTLTGDTMLARQGASLLTAAGLPDWVATSVADYVDKAVAAARNLPKLAALRAELREQASTSPLFDARRFARNLEEALRGMWQTWLADRQKETA